MITAAVFGFGLLLVGGLLGMVPAFALPESVTSAGASVGGTLGSVNGIFPVVTLGACLAAVLALWVFVNAWGLIVMVYDRIPFKAT